MKAIFAFVTQSLLQCARSEEAAFSATVELVAVTNGYRLPTEAEWEFAARGGDPSAEAWDYTFSGAATAPGVPYNERYNSGVDAVGWYWFNSVYGHTCLLACKARLH